MPLLNNCGPHSAVIGPSLTLVNTGSILQASTSYASSLTINKLKEDYADKLNVTNICQTVHTAELNEVFFETLEHSDCIYDPMSIYR